MMQQSENSLDSVISMLNIIVDLSGEIQGFFEKFLEVNDIDIHGGHRETQASIAPYLFAH